MKQYFRDRKELNYAYNINNSPNNIKSKKISFNSLSKNFYEDLIKSDSRIKTNRQRLSKIKSKSIKESIYSNKIISGSWKIMLDYQPTVYKAIDKDPSFAYYLGRSQNDNNNTKFQHAVHLKSVNDMQSIGQKSMSSFIKKFFVENSEEKENLKKEQENYSMTESRKELEKVENKIMRRTLLFQGRDKTHFNDKNMLIDDKLISSKLDEYRTKYDLNKYMKDIKDKKEEDKNKKKALNILSFQEAEERENNYKQFLKTRTKSDKERVLKSSIYYNLIATHSNDNIKKENNDKYKKLNKIKLKPLQTGNMFLFHNEEFDKVIEITNPKIKRDLELINYYGPLYTHCKFCNNRNLEFYKNSEPNQTLKLLQYLKKIKLGDTEDKEDKKN